MILCEHPRTAANEGCLKGMERRKRLFSYCAQYVKGSIIKYSFPNRGTTISKYKNIPGSTAFYGYNPMLKFCAPFIYGLVHDVSQLTKTGP